MLACDSEKDFWSKSQIACKLGGRSNDENSQEPSQGHAAEKSEINARRDNKAGKSISQTDGENDCRYQRRFESKYTYLICQSSLLEQLGNELTYSFGGCTVVSAAGKYLALDNEIYPDR